MLYAGDLLIWIPGGDNAAYGQAQMVMLVLQELGAYLGLQVNTFVVLNRHYGPFGTICGSGSQTEIEVSRGTNWLRQMQNKPLQHPWPK